jgi:hypothetical protein
MVVSFLRSAPFLGEGGRAGTHPVPGLLHGKGVARFSGRQTLGLARLRLRQPRQYPQVMH